jgi:hypothetical protein
MYVWLKRELSTHDDGRWRSFVQAQKDKINRHVMTPLDGATLAAEGKVGER